MDNISTAGAKAPPKNILVSAQDSNTSLNERSHLESHARHLVDVLVHSAKLSRKGLKGEDRVQSILEFWISSDLVKETPIEKLMKWFYGNSLGWITGTEVVDEPWSTGLRRKSALKRLFPRDFAEWINSMLRHKKHLYLYGSPSQVRKVLSLGQTLLQAKKGTPQVQEELIRATEAKHRIALGTEPRWYSRAKRPKGNWAEKVEFDKEAELDSERNTVLERKLDEIIDSLFKPSDWSVLLKKKTPFPSFSAHTFYSRSTGGAVREVASAIELQEVSSEFEQISPDPLYSNVYGKSWDQVWDDVFWQCSNSRFAATPVFLREPLKVRTITKGDSFPYWVLKPIQQLMHERLRNHPTFRLIGAPITSDYLDSRFIGEEPGKMYVSGDYSAATDNLGQRFSRYAWNRIMSRIRAPNWLRRLGSKALVGHLLIYGSKKEQVLVRQRNGQLMGSPVSFPILCLVNAAVCACSFTVQKELQDLPLAINGDDCVMRFDAVEERRWRELSKHVGMTPSPGKCYTAQNWLQMNSELYLRTGSKFERIPFLNFSLASPFVAKGGEERHYTSYGACARAFIQGFPEKRQVKLISIWIERMRPYLEKVPLGMSWFLPLHLGGLGIPCFDLDKHVTRPQLQIASYCFEQILHGSLPKMPTADIGLPPWVRRTLRELAQLERVTPVFAYREPHSIYIKGQINPKYDKPQSLQMFEENAGIIRSKLGKRLENSWDLSLDQASKARVVLQSPLFAPFLWRDVVQEGWDSDYRWNPIDDKLEQEYLKNRADATFGRLRKKAKKTKLLSLNTVLQLEAVESWVPGRISEYLERAYSEPKAMYAELTARAEIRAIHERSSLLPYPRSHNVPIDHIV